VPGEPVVDVEPFLATLHEPERVEKLEVLGHVRLPEARGLHQLRYRALAVPEGIEDPQPRGLGQRLEALGHQLQQLGAHLVSGHGCSPLINNRSGMWSITGPPGNGAGDDLSEADLPEAARRAAPPPV